MLRNELNAIALNVDEKSPRRNEAALVERQLAYTQKILEKAGLIREYWSKIPDENKKSFHQVMADFMALIWRYYTFDNATYRFWFTVNDCIVDYFAQKMYKVDIDTVASQYEWIRYHHEYEKANKDLVKTICNKHLFREFFHNLGFPVSEQLGHISFHDGLLAWCDEGHGLTSLDNLWNNGREEVFCKPELDSMGNGCFKLGYQDGSYTINGKPCMEEDLSAAFREPKLIEEVVVNHPLVKALHPESLNTCRLITLRSDDGRISLFQAIMRMGVGDCTVDNLYHGGLATNIKPDGFLHEFAVYDDYTKPKTPKHPDSGFLFKDVQLPYYKEAVDMVIEAHSQCKELRSIGWDVAITSEGPVLIEGNIHYSINPLYGGLRHEMVKYFTPAE
ncbi:MAG: hypothetical protein KBT28_12150 [Bacteroidales bacterium]|nr:hypothetical protein [Candidatus Colimorpha merdihippi]